MKHWILFSLFFSLSGLLYAQSLQYSNLNLDQALEKAHAENQLLFIQIEGDCKECNEVADKGLSGPKLTTIYSNFICLCLPFDSEDHRVLEQQLHFHSRYPTSLFLDSDGYFLAVMGNRSTSRTSAYIELAAEAMSKEKFPPFRQFELRYQSGNYDETFLKEYIQRLRENPFFRADDLVEEYVKGLKVADLYEDTTIMFLMRCSPMIDSDIYRLLHIDESRYDSLFFAMPFDERKRINREIIRYSRQKAIDVHDSRYMRTVANFIRRSYADSKVGWRAMLWNMLDYYRLVDDTVSYIGRADSYYRRFYGRMDLDSVAHAEMKKFVTLENGAKVHSSRSWRNGNELNNMAWHIYEISDDPEILGRVLKWSKRLLVYDDPRYIDTYAHILYKIGNTSAAVKWEQKAIDIHNSRISIPNEKLETELKKMKNHEL
ncbi:MAG TPA: hypothetical protein VKA27_03545 [Sunxiuqinia sp.]|nr:hypothetical protein [Sunxiuqinia sp.]